MYETTGRCNQRCLFCYNPWKTPGTPPARDLSTAEAAAMLDRAIRGSGCERVALSGGEPLLRGDVFEIAAFVKSRGAAVSLVTNGVLLDAAAADRCAEVGVDLVQVSLLDARREVHNRLAGFDGYDAAVEAIIALRERGVPVSTFFVALAENTPFFRATLELNVLLGVERVAFGRFTPGGEGLAAWLDLVPSPAAVDEALAAAQEMSGKYRLAVSAATPILPCLHDLSRYPRVRFGFCSAARSEGGLFAIDPEGRLKPCSHSPRVLGDLRARSFAELAADPYLRDFSRTLPAFCRDCPDASMCRGGCRSSAHVGGGALDAEDPYLAAWKSAARRPAAPTFVAATGEAT